MSKDSRQNTRDGLSVENIEALASDPKTLEHTLDLLLKYEQTTLELAQTRSNLQIEKFIALDNPTPLSMYNSILKNRLAMAEGLAHKITEMQSRWREFDYKWKDKDLSKPIEWFTREGGKKLCWNDLDAFELKTYLYSCKVEIKDRGHQIEFMDQLLAKIESQLGRKPNREDMLNDDPKYYLARLVKQSMDEVISRHTGINPGNILSIRNLEAPTIVDDGVNRAVGSPDLRLAFTNPGEFIDRCQEILSASLNECVDGKLTKEHELHQGATARELLNAIGADAVERKN